MNWLQRARKTGEFHARMLKENDAWTVEETAAVFDRKKSSVYDDLLICQWLKTHERELLKIRTFGQAIAFIRSRRKIMKQEVA